MDLLFQVDRHRVPFDTKLHYMHLSPFPLPGPVNQLQAIGDRWPDTRA